MSLRFSPETTLPPSSKPLISSLRHCYIWYTRGVQLCVFASPISCISTVHEHKITCLGKCVHQGVWLELCTCGLPFPLCVHIVFIFAVCTCNSEWKLNCWVHVLRSALKLKSKQVFHVSCKWKKVKPVLCGYVSTLRAHNMGNCPQSTTMTKLLHFCFERATMCLSYLAEAEVLLTNSVCFCQV